MPDSAIPNNYGYVESPLQKPSLSSRITQALAAPVAALSLGALSAPAEIFLISPPECEKVAKVDPVVAYGMLTSELVDRSDRELYELTLSRVKGMAEDAMSQHLCELAVALHDDRDGVLGELLGQGLSRWVELRERDRILEAGGEPWQMSEHDPFLEMLEKYPNLRVYPLLEEPIRDLLNRFPPRP